VILPALGDRDMAAARFHRHSHLAAVFADEIARNGGAMTDEQRADLGQRIERHKRLADELQQAVAEFDQVRESA
jgi:hypothetical protein